MNTTIGLLELTKRSNARGTPFMARTSTLLLLLLALVPVSAAQGASQFSHSIKSLGLRDALSMSPDAFADRYAKLSGDDSPSNATYSFAIERYVRLRRHNTERNARALSRVSRSRYRAARRELESWQNEYLSWNVSFDLGGTYWCRPANRAAAYLEITMDKIERLLSRQKYRPMTAQHKRSLRLLAESLIREAQGKKKQDVYHEEDKSRFEQRKLRLLRITRAMPVVLSTLPDDAYDTVRFIIANDIKVVKECSGDSMG